MIDKILALGLTALGATMITKKGGLFIESSTYSDFEANDNVITAVKVAEGLVEKAYKLPNETQYTIGFGTSYLFDKDGKPYSNAGTNAVKAGDTLTLLKSKMSYSSLSNSDFAEELIKNHLKASRYSKVAKDLDSFGVPFRQSFAEALMEVSYGSGSIFGYLRSDIYYIDFLNNARNAKTDKDFATAYIRYRYNYYKNCTMRGQWSTYKYGWMRRVVRLTFLILGRKLSENELSNYVGYTESLHKKKASRFRASQF